MKYFGFAFSILEKSPFLNFRMKSLDGEILSPRFKITTSARSFDVALEGRSTGPGGSFGFNTSKRIDQKFCGFVSYVN